MGARDDIRTRGNLFANLRSESEAESIERLVDTRGVRIERIVSTGQSSPEDFWYDQDEDEWVALLSGEATLRLLESNEAIEMRPGDWIRIPAHRRHRVDSTSKREPTVWLAVHFAEST